MCDVGLLRNTESCILADNDVTGVLSVAHWNRDFFKGTSGKNQKAKMSR